MDYDMRMDVRVKLSRYHHDFVEALQKFMISWNFDPCGLESMDPWTGIFVSSTADGPVAPKPQECAAEECVCESARTEMWKCTHKREKAYGMTNFNPFSELSPIYICEDCGVLLGDL